MRPKAESTTTSKKSRANNLIVSVEFLLKFTSNNGLQLLLDILLNLTPEKDCLDWIAIWNQSCVHTCISFFNNFNFFESQETINVLRLDISEIELLICIQIFLQNFEKMKKGQPLTTVP